MHFVPRRVPRHAASRNSLHRWRLVRYRCVVPAVPSLVVVTMTRCDASRCAVALLTLPVARRWRW
jgi:hypothetical protein